MQTISMPSNHSTGMKTTELADSYVLKCGGCQHHNHVSDKFCTGCGHTLYENCPGCGQSVTLLAKFCNACGCDLKAHLESRLGKADESMAKSIELVKKFQFYDAINLLKAIAKEKDYRFRDHAVTASSALAKIEGIKDQAVKQVAAAKEAALVAAKTGDHQAVVEHLESVAEELLDKEAYDLLQQGRRQLKQASQCKADLRQALNDKDWTAAAQYLETLLGLFPGHSTYKKLTIEVSERLLGQARCEFENHRYDEAHDKMQSVSAECRSEEFESLKHDVDDALWLADQFAPEPFATPTLGRLALRLSKQIPSNPLGRTLVTQIASKIKEPPAHKQEPFAAWTGSQESILGGNLHLLGWPRCLGDALPDPIKKNPFRFGVAAGLALQGIGEAKFDDQLNERKGFLSNFRSNKSQTAWGIDIGTHAVRAICLTKDKSGYSITGAYMEEYAPSNQITVASEMATRIRECLLKMSAELKLEGAKIWASFPARETLPRFVLLPPVDEKKVKQLVDAEVNSQFPIEVDQLSLMKFVAEAVGDREGRPVSLVSARKLAVNQRLDLLNSAGLKVTGLQCEPVALANYAAIELADFFGTESPERNMSSLAIVDSGASSTSLILLHRDGFWFRTIDCGGADMTSAIARAAKVVASEAELLKRDPSKIEFLAETYAEVEKKQQYLSERLRQLVFLAQQSFPALQVDQTWLIGGNTMCHGFARRLARHSVTPLISD